MYRLSALILLILGAAHVARADEPPPRSVAVVVTSSRKGDKALKDLLASSLRSTKQFDVVDRPEDADLIAQLEVSRSRSDTTLMLTVVDRSGTLVARTLQSVPLGGSLVDATDLIVGRVAATFSDSSAPTVTPPRPSIPLHADSSTIRPPPTLAPEETERFYAPTETHPHKLDFVAGLELGGGPWAADSTKIVSKAGFDFSRYGPAFTQTIDQQWHVAIDAHGGWRFFDLFSLEAAVHSSGWSGGGAVLPGVRVTAYPLPLFLAGRDYDVGIEVGGGYAFVSGSSYDMDGSYFSFGLTGLYRLKPWLSVEVFYRLFTPFLSRFYVDYTNQFTEPVNGFTAYWNTFGIGASFHLTKDL